MNKLTPVALITLTALLTFSGIAFAENATKGTGKAASSSVKEARKDAKSEVKEARKEAKEEKQELKQEERASTTAKKNEMYKQPLRNLREESKAKEKSIWDKMKDMLKTATSSGARKEIRGDAKDEIKILMEQKRASSTAVRAQYAEYQARQYILNIKRTLESVIVRFDDMVARMESRIAKLKSGGTNTTSVEPLLAQAKIVINQARASVQLVSNLASQATTTINVIALRAQVTTLVASTTPSIRTARNALEAVSNRLLIIAPPGPKR